LDVLQRFGRATHQQLGEEVPLSPSQIGRRLQRLEAAGVIDAVGPGVMDLVPGQRVAYAGMPTGSYASLRTMPAARVLPIPA
ncbi:AsnC family transcriptional regulator, partial [Clostridioides difficile]|nr:AsnC family transcriptional regulator [Clostridioides difficile]